MISRDLLYVGIDFGTSYSKIARYNPKTDEAQILHIDGYEQTPSLVYFDRDHTSTEDKIEVGQFAQYKLEEAEERDYVIKSIKRDLLFPVIALPHRTVPPAKVVEEILRKLKTDAEDQYFHGKEIKYVILTHPVTFGHEQRNKLREAAYAAGFTTVELYEEPIAAAIAYGREVMDIGQNILIYDLGGGTFDLAILTRKADGEFETPIAAKGLLRCGGDDFDRKIYDYCNEKAQGRFDREMNGKLNLHFLKQCCDFKENLVLRNRHRSQENPVRRSPSPSIPWRLLLDDGSPFQVEIGLDKFEELIQSLVEETVTMAKAIIQEARDKGYEIDTCILIGGSTRIPLVKQMFTEHLPGIKLREWAKGNVAVALGAAYHAYEWWNPEAQYRRFVTQFTEEKMSEDIYTKLTEYITELGLEVEQAAEIERDLLNTTKEAALQHQKALEQYQEAVEKIRSDLLSVLEIQLNLLKNEIQHLTILAQQLGLSEYDAFTVEEQVLGGAKEPLLVQQENRALYRATVKSAWINKQLKESDIQKIEKVGKQSRLSSEDMINIERDIMGDTKEVLLAHQQDCTRYTEKVRAAWQARQIDETSLQHLKTEAAQLHISKDEAAQIERMVMQKTKEQHFQHYKALKEYEQRVETYWQAKYIDQARYQELVELERQLGLSGEEAAEIERRITDAVKRDNNIQWLSSQLYLRQVEKIWEKTNKRPGLNDFDQLYDWTNILKISRDETEVVERAVMGQTKEQQSDVLIGAQMTGFVLTHTLLDHQGAVTALAFHPDGKTLVSSSTDTLIKFWNVKTGKLNYRLYATLFAPIRTIAISPNTKVLVSASDNKKIGLWNMLTKERLDSFIGHDAPIFSVAINPHGDILASGGADNKVKLWSLFYERKLLYTLSGHTGRVDTVTFSPDGKTLVSGSQDKTIKLWDTSTGKLKSTLTGHNNWVCSLKFSPDGKSLVSGSNDKTVKIWDLSTGIALLTLRGHTDIVNTIALSPDGKVVASGGADKTIRLWSFRTGELLHTLTGPTAPIYTVTFSPTREWLACGGEDKLVRIWKTNQKQ